MEKKNNKETETEKWSYNCKIQEYFNCISCKGVRSLQ